MVSTSDFNWTLPHGRMQFCHMVTYDPVLRTRISGSLGFSFEIRNSTCTTCCCRHDDLQFLESTKSVATAYCIFEQFLNAEKIVVVLQPSAAAQRYAGSTHTVSGNCWHASRYAGNRTHAAVYPPVSNFWCATMSAHQNPDPADQGPSGAAQDTKGPPTCSQDT